MRRRNKKDAEKFLVREFLEDALGLNLRRLICCSPPRPDAYAVIETDSAKEFLDIELTEYHVDAAATQSGGSPMARQVNFWRRVQESLYRRLIQTPVQVDVRVYLKDSLHWNDHIARPLAGELVRFVRHFDFATQEVASVAAFGPQFPILAQCVRKLNLTKVEFRSLFWSCANTSAAAVGLMQDRVAELIDAKSRKHFEWAIAQKWLLVCASGSSIVGTAGPRPRAAAWRATDIRASCRGSPFDRIYFWDRPHGWHKRLK